MRHRPAPCFGLGGPGEVPLPPRAPGLYGVGLRPAPCGMKPAIHVDVVRDIVCD